MGNEELTADQQKIGELLVRISNLEEQNRQLVLFSDPIRVNSTIYQGLRLLLEKVTNIEERLGTKEDKKPEDGKN